ncbi:MAG: response regulator [Proteobacteria bacterium]|nr:response regulator [Pseudomonadota bacterium]
MMANTDRATVDIKKKKVLVVDNNPVILKLMHEFLTRSGHDATCVGDVFGCLDTLVEMTPDVIFIDLIMPRIGGDDLCRILRNMDNLQNCYLAIVSGVAIEEQLDYRQLGADALIAKGPFNEMRLHILQALSDSEKPRHDITIPTLQGAENLHVRQVSQELLQNNHHLKFILESMSQGVIELLGTRIAYINPKAAKFLGLPREKLLGRYMSATFPQLLLDAMAAISTKHQPSPGPIQLNGYQVILEHFAVAGPPPSTMLMLSDITERRQMEVVIEAANLTKNLGYVFSGIRHEIGNPVNSIKMALSVLQRNLAEYDRDTIALFVDRSLQEVTRLEYLLKALKNYSLFERPVMEKLPVAVFLTDFISLIRNDFENHHIKIHRILPNDDLLVLADSRALHHIMLNLITNAADALSDCQNPQIIVSAGESPNGIEIKVDDNGKGISEADQQNLFKPFFTSKAAGTGLGLVIVQKMLLAMNGRISVESYQGMGTTVIITLPGVDR